MFSCGACCKREQPVQTVLQESPIKSDAAGGDNEPLPGEAGDPFLADNSSPPAAKLVEEKVAEPIKEVQAKEVVQNTDTEFTLVLDRYDPVLPLGAHFDASMPTELFVTNVMPHVDGLVQHAERTSGTQLKAGDFIMSVNGVTGSEMPKELQSARHLSLKVRRPMEFEVEIEKAGGTLGCSITYDAHTGMSLGVSNVLDGPIQRWNESGSGEKVQEGDRIVCVNGVRGFTSQLLEAIRAASQLKLTLARPSP